MEIDVALELNRTGQPLPGGHQHRAAPGRSARVDGRVDRLPVVCGAVANRAEISDVEDRIGKRWPRQLGHFEWRFDGGNCVGRLFGPNEGAPILPRGRVRLSKRL